MRHLRLYGKRDCSLCDKAQSLVRDVLARVPGVQLEVCDIEDDPALFGRYGLRIPVLEDAATGTALDWPFDRAAVELLLQDE